MSTPAFQFYAKDFLSATQSWSIEEVGIYIRLLCAQWDTGGLPDDELRMARIAGTDLETFKKAWVFLGFKFLKDVDGLLKNSRLEETRMVQDVFREKQRKNAVKGGRPKKSTENKNPDKTQIKPKNIPNVNPNNIPNKTSSSVYIQYGLNNDAFIETFEAFLEMRKKAKSIPTDKAVISIFKKVKEFSNGDIDKAIEIVDQSLRNNWKGIFPLAENKIRSINSYKKVIPDGRPVN